MPATHTELNVDMTQPASSILRAGTIKMHDEISKSETATYLTKGELDREDYIWYLMMLWHIYKALEAGLAANAYDSVLSPTYNPALLARGSALSSDISFLLGVPDDDRSWKSHQANQALLLSPPPAFRAYISRLARIIEEDPRRLLAHSYIRYMGDLSGGQIMKGNIRKAYGLTDDQGTRFYNFGVMGSEGQSDPALANMGEVKRIKEWFKNGIDAGVGNNIELKGALLDETTRAFLLHKDLFDEIKASVSKIQKSVVCASSPMPLDRERKSSRMFSVHSVLTFMLAVGFAHFIVVVGGLSGSRGYEKLEAVRGWVPLPMSTFPSLESLEINATETALSPFLRTIADAQSKAFRRLKSAFQAKESGTFSPMMLAAIRHSGSHQTLTRLSITPKGRFDVDTAFIRPLLFMAQMTHLEIEMLCGRQCPFKLSDEDLEELVKAMPKLESLFLGSFPCSHPANNTIKSLVSIAKHCKRLCELVIHTNVEAVIDGVSQRGYWGGNQTSGDPLSIFVGCPVQAIIFGPCFIPDEGRGAIIFALTLLRLFPCLHDVDFYPPTPESEPLWDMVKGLITTCGYIGANITDVAADMGN